MRVPFVEQKSFENFENQTPMSFYQDKVEVQAKNPDLLEVTLIHSPDGVPEQRLKF